MIMADAKDKTEEKTPEKKAQALPSQKEEKKETAKADKKDEKKGAKKDDKKEEKKEVKMVSLSLRGAICCSRTKRAKAAMRVLKEQLKRHVKRDVLISAELNALIWRRGIEHPPRKVKARVEITKDKATAYPVE
jgi:ribosomal protein L31E